MTGHCDTPGCLYKPKNCLKMTFTGTLRTKSSWKNDENFQKKIFAGI